MGAIPDIYLRMGETAGEGQRARGGIYANMINSLGQTIAAIPGQYAEREKQITAQKLQQQQLAQSTLQTKEMQADSDALDLMQKTLQDPANHRPDGTVDTGKVTDALRSQNVRAWQKWQTVSDAMAKNSADLAHTAAETAALNTTADEKKRTMQQAQADYLGHIAYQGNAMLQQKPDDALHARDTTLAIVARAAADGAITPEQARDFMQQTASATPQQMQQVFQSFVTPTAKAAGDKAAAENAEHEAQAAAHLATATRQPAVSSAADDQRYEAILMKTKLHPDLLTDEDRAFKDAYEQRKTVVTDAAATAAAARQAAAQEQANALQKRGQDFQLAKEAREDLSKTVEFPYLQARASADTLRDTVEAAKKGNKIAAQLQSLETTMAAIRAQGLNRINTVELGHTQSAGSLFDRIENFLGKADTGQPMSPELQKDMQEFADILDAEAYKQYGAKFDTIAKYYELTPAQSKALKLAAPDTPEGRALTATAPTAAPPPGAITRGQPEAAAPAGAPAPAAAAPVPGGLPAGVTIIRGR